MFFVFFVCFFVLFSCFQKKEKNWIGVGRVVSGQSEFFSDFLFFFNLTRPLTQTSLFIKFGGICLFRYILNLECRLRVYHRV